MIDRERMADAADHLIMWLVTGDNRERLAGLDAVNDAIRGVGAVETTKALGALVAEVNDRIAITPARSLN